MNLPDTVRQFRDLYPASGEPVVWRAPGRVNLIGEHTDYNLGLVLPMAIDLACYVTAAPSKDGRLRAYSQQFQEVVEWRLEDLAAIAPRGHWSDRVAGVVWVLLRQGIPINATDLLIDSEVPLGGGLSSSAALGVALTLALSENRPGIDVAGLARAAEVDTVGLPCGIMDQFISVKGQPGAAIFLDCRSLQWHPVPLPRNCAMVVVNSMVKHELANSAYRTRVAECAEAAKSLGVASLRYAELSQIDGLDPVLRRRARHVITENNRVQEFVDAAMAGDVGGMGRLVTQSHESLRDDHEVSCAELDFLVETALNVEGVVGSRMIGGGFGGSTLALLHPGRVEALQAAVRTRYREFSGMSPEVQVSRASAGASRVYP